ncbi:sulfatase-like hydrolase/transferase [Paenibacillus arenilitoris]|uniref:Sulfatase-like hydrolase/transferase n=1 Tax=Paenibacillus arenilitoris TaxID=2772299 RepID=A0A927H6X5_9BACL|nr:sulfatase-like hydrolase/transferase [Paenibacillus arenilitoris]MBD2869014.1 sulfatase-like hydrolase/transferase [Paenibacillus arenilitoris]
MTDRKPNIVWIMLDHVTFRHYKMTSGAKPALIAYERLAGEGAEFTQCRSVHPLCLPARASMMTGVYAHKHRKYRNREGQEDAGYPLYFETLAKQGYRVGYFGKNHSGFELQPLGVEGFYPGGYGNPYLTDEYKRYLTRNGLEAPVFVQEWGINQGRFPNGEYDLTETNNFNTYSSGYIKSPGPVHESDFLLAMAEDWLTSETSPAGQPFSLRVDIWGPHQAYQVPLASKDTIDPRAIEEYPSFADEMKDRPGFVQSYHANIRDRNAAQSWEEWQPVMQRAYEHYNYIENAVHRFLDRLEALGLADNTVVLYTADHGDSLGSHGGMVDKAGDMMEELMHIPLVVRGPGVKAGARSEALVSNFDLVPTVLELAGAAVPEWMDGRSLVSELGGAAANRREDFMAEHYGHFDVHAVQRALYYKNYKYVASDEWVHELYDLQADPFEMNNLCSDPAYAPILSEMRARLLANMKRFDDTGDDSRRLARALEAAIAES